MNEKALPTCPQEDGTYKAIGEFLSIYEHYDEAQQDAEFIVRYPQAVAENNYHGNEKLQAILESIKNYWDQTITPAIERYVKWLDASDQCNAEFVPRLA